MSATKAEARLRVQRALDHIQAAQDEIDRARQELSSVIGAMPEYDKLGRLYETIRRNWYAISATAARKALRGKLDLDEMGRAALERDNAEPTP